MFLYYVHLRHHCHLTVNNLIPSPVALREGSRVVTVFMAELEVYCWVSLWRGILTNQGIIRGGCHNEKGLNIMTLWEIVWGILPGQSMIAHFQSLVSDLAKWTSYCFPLKGGRGINMKKLLACQEGVSKNGSLGNQIFSIVMSVETELDSWFCHWGQIGSPLLTPSSWESMTYIQPSFGAK